MKGAYIFNETIDFSQIGSTGDFISKIPFMSKNTRFDSLDIDVSSGVIRYNNVDVYTEQGWTNQKYRTITLFEDQEDNEWSPNQILVEQWIRENSVKIQTKKRAKLTKTSSTGAPETTEIYAKAYVTDIINEDGSQWIPSLAGSGGMGGGGSGAVSITTITNPEVTTSLGVKTELEFEWSSEADGNGTLQIYVDGDLKKTTLAKQGIVKVDITNYVSMATDYLVRLVIEDAFGSKRALNYQVSVINLIVNSTFDQTQAYTGTITYRYTPFGSVSKTMHFVLDGVEKTQVVETSGREQTLEIKDLTHGVHTLKVYATATFGDTTIPSNELNYKFAYYQEGNSEPIIVIFNNENETFEEGQTVKINYLVYTATSETTDITLHLNDRFENLTVDRQPKVWSINDYIVGLNTIAIAVQGLDVSNPINKTLAFNITAATITIKPFETGLQLYLASDTKSNEISSRNEWTYNNITTTFNNFNFVSDGWLPDNNNIVGLKMTGDANIEINFQPFADDPKANGKTIELEFATSNVTNFDATVINIMANNRGILVKPNEIFLKSTGKEVSTRFKEEEHIRVSMVIESSTSNKFISTYINGVLSGIDVYGGDDNFQQTTPVNIKAGSTECDLTLYKIRVYNTQLTASNILDNYIADNSNYDEKTKIYRRNQIYDSYGNVLYNKVKNIMPVVTITAPILPSAKDEVQTLTSLKLENINNPTLNWEYNNLEFEIQGTSSVQYPVKNLEFKFGEDVIQLYPDAIPENRLTLKVDYASSAGVFNMGNAKIVNGIYQEKNPRQEEDARVRNALYGYPVAVFYRKTASDNLQFYCKGSLNLSKKANALGYKEGDESWETKNNTSPLCLFDTNDFSTLSSDFEYRYNKSGSSANLEALISWVYSCKGNPTKFRNECVEHFNLHYLLTYYVYGQIMGGADSYAKNLYLGFFAEGQNEDGTYYGKWYPEFYDLDTSYGIDNTGRLKFEYSTELNDMVEDRYAFNGHNSVLWNLVQTAYADELKTLYQTLRNGEIVTYDTIMEVLQTQGIEQYTEAIYNEDAKIKYIDPYLKDGENYLSTALGSTLEHLKYWVNNRLKYLDSKWIASEYSKDRIVTRITTPEDVTPDYSITLKSRNDMYMQIQYGSYYAKQRATRNTQYTLTPDIPTGTVFNDTEAYIYGASTLTSVGDLSKWYVTLLDISKATSLTELKVGDSSANYSNANLKEFTAGANTLLRSIDLTNCVGLEGNIDLSGCTSLQYLYASGTQITSVSFANGGQLKQAVLPNTITALTLINLKSIQSITTNGEFTTIRIENSNVDSLSYVETSIAANKLERLRLLGIDWTLADKSLLNYLVQNVKGINSIGNNQDKSVLSGKIHIAGDIFSDEITEFREYWGTSLTITADNIIYRYRCRFYDYDGTLLYQTAVYKGESVAYVGQTPHRPIDEVNKIGYLFSGWDKSQNNIKQDTDFYPTFIAKPMVKATFVNYDGTVLYEDEVIAGTKAEYGGLTPEKPRDYDLQIKYVFKEWTPNINQVIEDNTTFTPIWEEIDFYKVEWKNYDGTVLETDYVDYGGKATYDGETPTRPTDAQYVYTFSGWSPNPENTTITSNTTFTAGYSLKALCKVTLKNADGTVFDEIGVGNGEQFDYHSTPTPPDNDAQYQNYEFASWQLNGVDVTLPITVTTNITLTPRFEGTLRKYSVFWYVNGELMETDVGVPYGTVGISYDGVTPEKDGYIFSGWNTVENSEESINTSTYQVVGDTYMYAVFLDKYAAAAAEAEIVFSNNYSTSSPYALFEVWQVYNSTETTPTNNLLVDFYDGNGFVEISPSSSNNVFSNYTYKFPELQQKRYNSFAIAKSGGWSRGEVFKIKIKYIDGLVLYPIRYKDIKKLNYFIFQEYLFNIGVFDNDANVIFPLNIRYYYGPYPFIKDEIFEIPKSVEFFDGSVLNSSAVNKTVKINQTFDEFIYNVSDGYSGGGSQNAFVNATKIIFDDKTINPFENENSVDLDFSIAQVSFGKIRDWKCIDKISMNSPYSYAGSLICNKVNSDEDGVADLSLLNSGFNCPKGKYKFIYNGAEVEGFEKVILPLSIGTPGSFSTQRGSLVLGFCEYVENVIYNGDINGYCDLGYVPSTKGFNNLYINGVLQTSDIVPEILSMRAIEGQLAFVPYKKIIMKVAPKRNCFYGCPNLQTVEFSNVAVTSLPNECFSHRNLPSLPELINAENITSYGEGIFWGGKVEHTNWFSKTGFVPMYTYRGFLSYPVIKVEEGVSRINQDAFRTEQANIVPTTLIVLPTTLTLIENRGMYIRNTDNSKYSVVCKAETPPSIAGNSLYNSYITEYIVPTNSVDAYKAATTWSGYASKIVGGAENYD